MFGARQILVREERDAGKLETRRVIAHFLERARTEDGRRRLDGERSVVHARHTGILYRGL